MVIHIEIVSAEQAIFKGQAKFISLPGEEGSLGILPGHTPIISKVRPGMVAIELENGQHEYVFIAGGILEVQPHAVNILADTAVRGDALDEEKILQAKASVEARMQNPGADFNLAKAQSELAISVAQLAAIAHMRKKRY